MSERVETTEDLRRILVDTIADVRAGKIRANEAHAIAAIGNTILQSARLDVMAGRDVGFDGESQKIEPLRLIGHSPVQPHGAVPELASLMEDDKKRMKRSILVSVEASGPSTDAKIFRECALGRDVGVMLISELMQSGHLVRGERNLFSLKK